MVVAQQQDLIDRSLSDREALGAYLKDQLASGSVALSAPERMRYRVADQVELVLSPEGANLAPEELLEDYIGRQLEIVEEVDYALRMQATLTAPEFVLEPEARQTRTILDDRPTKWAWVLTPAAFGDGKLIQLELSAILESEDGTLPETFIETFERTIVVDVSAWGRATAMAADVKSVHAAAVGIVASIAGVAAFLLRRRSSSKTRRSGPDRRHTSE